MYFTDDYYLIRRKILKLLGGAFHIYNAQQQVVGYSELKAFKLKEDIRLYTDETMSQEIFSIKARNILDIAATYDITDSSTGQIIGAARRRGLKSMLRDEWALLAPGDREIGIITEDSVALALVRRLLTNLVPQNYDCKIDGRQVCEFRQNFNPFVMKINVHFHDPDPQHRMLVMAAGILLCAIEGKQSS